jgi:hypothetical protein
MSSYGASVDGLLHHADVDNFANVFGDNATSIFG